jgi:hypothetical protein
MNGRGGAEAKELPPKRMEVSGSSKHDRLPIPSITAIGPMAKLDDGFTGTLASEIISLMPGYFWHTHMSSLDIREHLH